MFKTAMQVRWVFPARKQTEVIWFQSTIDAEVGFPSQEANRTDLISKYYRRWGVFFLPGSKQNWSDFKVL